MTFLKQQWQALRDGADSERNPGLRSRKDRLRRLGALLEQHEQDFCEALASDYGHRSATQSSFADITTTLKAIRHALLNLRYWMTPQRRSTELSLRMTGASSYTRYYPKGVVGIISPWNFPLNLSLSPLASALAAGNRAFLKPSEITEATSGLLADVIQRNFNADEVAIACGGVDVAQAFIQLPHDHLIYTGSTAIGRQIASTCADKLTPLTLELGGKCPVVVSESADVSRLAQRLFFGKYFNAGQICIAPDFVLLPQARLPELLKAFDRLVPAMKRANQQGDGVAIVNDRHRTRLDTLLADAEQHGATVVDPDGTGTLKIVINPFPEARIVREEIFGPVLLVMTTPDFGQSLSYIQSVPAPLAIYYFGDDGREWQQLAEGTRSGALVHNDIIMQYANDDLPFGGVGDSGLGCYRGVYGFREFSNLRAHYKTGLVDVSRITSPPYSPVFNALNKLMRHL